jgi:hypothetical protein
MRAILKTSTPHVRFPPIADTTHNCEYHRMATGATPAGGVVHKLPDDLRDALLATPGALAAWADITPIARNEWICWVTSPKKPETRMKRVAWGIESLEEGKRRPCCWPGCPHRNRGGARPVAEA